VILRSPTVWYSTLKVDKGSDDGVRRDQPVVAAGGLVGKVSDVTDGTAEVTLITDASSAVSAQVMPNGATGIVHPVVGDPDDLLLDFIAKGRRVTEGTTVVTSGFSSDGVQSIFPRGIAIGRVTRVDTEEAEQFQRVHIEPLADIRGIDYVRILTERGVSTQAGVPLQ
jgi:rod shape-determining protein MreC